MLDERTGVYQPGHATSFAYSDGDAQEEGLLAILRSTDDCSVLSDDLRNAITDWPSEYHLSSARANLLRHLPIAPGDTVLELGAGCGALTRWLGETGADVVAVEGSVRRAAIVKARCRDLANVTVVSDHIMAVDAPPADWVLLVGVLEYGNKFISGEDPVAALLAHARQRVTDRGALVVAIENQLGLKYWNGCAEDHLGVAYYGVEDLYRPRDPVTFGRRELDRRLAEAGFASREFHLPFPDYKLPLVVLGPRALEAPELDLTDLVSRATSRDYAGSPWRAFNESLAWSPLIRNGLLADHANSFLIVAGAQPDARARFPADTLAWSYSNVRKARYQVATRVARGATGIEVHKTSLLSVSGDDGEFVQELVVSPYQVGSLASLQMLRHAERGDLDALLQSALPWLDLLLAAGSPVADRASASPCGALLLPPNFVDAIPGNVLMNEKGVAHTFDLEWSSRSPVPFEWVLLRGLALTLFGMVNSPLQGTRSVVEVAELLLALRERTLHPDASAICEAWETRFYTEVIASKLPTTSPLPASRLLAPLAGTFDGVLPAVKRLSGELVQAVAERNRLDGDTTELRRMFEGERAAHATNIAKLQFIDAAAHASASALHRDIETLRATLTAEQAMHAENIVKLQAADARSSDASAEIVRLHSAGELARVEFERAQAEAATVRSDFQRADAARYASELALTAARTQSGELKAALFDAAKALDSVRSELAGNEAQLAHARARIDAQVTELAWLHQERSTFGAKMGRAITRQRNRWFPVDSARGRAVTLAARFAVALTKEGPTAALRRTGRFVHRRVQPAALAERVPRDAGRFAAIPGGGIASPPELARWIAAHEPDDAELGEQRRSAAAWPHRPLISFVVPVYRVPSNILAAALDSLQRQTYAHWEACIACAEDAQSDNWQVLVGRARDDDRLRPFLVGNAGISGNSNAALDRAAGDFVALLDHDDALSASALFAVVARLQDEPDLDFLYTDKDSVDEAGSHRQYALFKPAWSPEMLHSVNYLTHLNVMRRTLLQDVGGWRPETDGAQDWDLFLRVTERTSRIARVPGLHYHWRIIATSVATGIGAKPYAAAAQLRCQRDRLERLRWAATAEPDEESGFRVVWSAPATPHVEVIVHAEGAVSLRHCLDGLRAAKLDDVTFIRVLVTPSCADFAHVHRDFTTVWGARVAFEQGIRPLAPRLVEAARSSGAPIVVLLDARARYLAPLALEELGRWVSGAAPIAWAAGIVLAPGDVVREAGRIAHPDGTSAPLFRDTPLRSWGWFGGALWHRNASAASPALFALRRADLAALAPDPSLSFSRWWTRACFTLRGDTRRGLITPHARAWFECDIEETPVQFDERFRADPYFHPAFCSVSPLHLMP